MGMRLAECPKCRKSVDLAGKKRFVKSLLSGDSQAAFCPKCNESFIFRLEGRVVIDL